MKTALVHHWLVASRGGERVLEGIAELFPTADLFTLVCDKEKIPSSLRRHRIRTSLLQKLPGAVNWYPYYLPLFPAATGQLDVSGYDLVISSDAATVKGVRANRHAIHVCYCHSPMRYVWTGYETYYRASGPLERRLLSFFRPSLRKWDYKAAQRVTHFIANSENVRNQILECYGRQSVVIYPPVDVDRFTFKPGAAAHDEFFLVVSQLVPYKRIDLVVDAFNRSGRRLVVVGDGPERRTLADRARSNVRLLGSQPDSAVVRLMQECKAFVFAGEEDFGIVMAEAQACGKPVLAFRRGGAAEIVRHNVTGVLFDEQSVDSLLEGLDQLDRLAFDPEAIRASALRFGRARFAREFGAFVNRVKTKPELCTAAAPGCA
jgi:glycosyltransferase involved in cell wall biosynthesis